MPTPTHTHAPTHHAPTHTRKNDTHTRGVVVVNAAAFRIVYIKSG